jgi:phytoene dehydrogenase-like protein
LLPLRVRRRQRVPYRVTGDATGRIRGTHWDAIEEAYADYTIDWLSERYLPGLRERISARTVHSPVDLERQIISAVHGTHQHGAFLPYQVGVMRPIPEFGNYRTSVPNVYLCGAGSHPGAGVTMSPRAQRRAGDLRGPPAWLPGRAR